MSTDSPLEQPALDVASFELQRHFGREGSFYGIKACEEIARIALVAYRRSVQSEIGAQTNAAAQMPAPVNEQAPCAWRYRYGKTGSWKYVDSANECNPSPEYERQPIYQFPWHQSATGETEKFRAALKHILWIKDGGIDGKDEKGVFRNWPETERDAMYGIAKNALSSSDSGSESGATSTRSARD